ncbi:MAG: trypsin-like peptidase domain-containing protein [Patescibacteria group bacterium]|nr:trypsin-like peptidase domain-containing protein [Patescibacteria group bacterium]MDD4303924.1 trypsin-like peptidase domain-containing protein [Patescibacteria group bacterium]MDD4695088.1 trypsin-like peptidase domain-containing protein [Patescibacteria group bacterium]
MKKTFLLLIVFLCLGAIPYNFSNAVTQSQISSTVQIVCPDNYGNWFSGSGTIIDQKGIILTNKHVVTDEYGGIIDTCFIGFVESISKEPNFGTEINPNLAEVKYHTTSQDMDVALLYLDNPTNKTYTYVDIWNSNSDNLKFGDKIEAVGFPGIGGSTITYTSGDFSGFGSNSDGTQNYIKTTTPLEHGNSGGSAYNSTEQFIGIPTMVVAGTLNSLSYLLSVNSIKNWLSEILGSQYQQGIVEQEPIIERPTTSIQNDITPPNFNLSGQLCYWVYEDNYDFIGGRCFPKNLGKLEPYNHIQFILFTEDLYKIDPNGLAKTYYYFDTVPHSKIDNNVIKYVPKYLNSAQTTLALTEIIDIDSPGKYYLTFFGEDNLGNVSSPYIYEYEYQPEIFKTIKNLYFYKDSNKKQPLKAYNVDFDKIDQGWMWEPLECYTRLDNITVDWKYPVVYEGYSTKKINSFTDFGGTKFTGNLQNSNQYTITNISNGKIVQWKENHYQNGLSPEEQIYQKSLSPHNNIYYEFYMNPTNSNIVELEHKHRFLKLIYNENLEQDLLCNDNLVFAETNDYPIIVDQGLSNRLKGKLLLQVNQGGRVWYVNPDDGKRFEVTFANALPLFEKFALGISNKDLEKISLHTNNWTSATGNRLKGKLLLQVEDGGRIWYVDFDGKRWEVTWANLMTLFESLSLGITNDNLNKIEIGSL